MTSDHEMREFNRRLERHYATMQSILARLTTLEQSCNASHAPSDGSSAASGGTVPAPSVDPATASGVNAKTSDPSAAVRDDPKRPGWLTVKHLPLPEGVERVYCDNDTARAYPGRWKWTGYEWSNGATTEEHCIRDHDEVYHVPAPGNEHQDHSPAEIEQERGEVFKVLPPLEIADQADALGWTPESWVWKCNRYGSIRVYPSSMVLESGKVFRTDLYETESVRHGDTLLPNRRVPVEGEKPATAWEPEGPREIAAMCRAAATMDYAEIIVREWGSDRERRAVEEANQGYRQGFKDGEAIAEHKHRELEKAVNHLAPPRPAKSAGEVAEEVWKQQNSTPIPASLQAWMVAAIERERGSR